MPRKAAERPKRLEVYLVDELVGHVEQDRQGRLAFIYDDRWRDGPIQIPLSLSMPLAQTRHGDDVVRPWLWGLLPEDPRLLQNWGRQFQVSPNNAFALLGAVGADCAGAVQFFPPGARDAAHRGTVEWITEEDIGERLAELRKAGSSGRRLGENGQFSLAGAQPKTAFHYDPDKKRWGVPSGRIPTTHILKPPMANLSGQLENEHFCLRLAVRAGLIATKSWVESFAGEQAIVIQRYDRLRRPGGVVRVHQEDMCQALGLMPDRKYEKDGGPGITRIVKELLARSDRPDIDRMRFIEAVILNFLLVGTDAHGKNYSMLLGPQGTARLAPLYDIISLLPHVADIRKAKLAMRIGRYYEVEAIQPRHWEEGARNAGLKPELVLGLLRHHIATLPDLMAAVAAELRKSGLEHPIIDRLPQLIGARLKRLKL